MIGYQILGSAFEREDTATQENLHLWVTTIAYLEEGESIPSNQAPDGLADLINEIESRRLVNVKKVLGWGSMEGFMGHHALFVPRFYVVFGG